MGTRGGTGMRMGGAMFSRGGDIALAMGGDIGLAMAAHRRVRQWGSHNRSQMPQQQRKNPDA